VRLDLNILAHREREYSPSSAIGGNYAPHIARYVSDSRVARSCIPMQSDLRYGAAERALIDFFPATQPSSSTGLLVFIHGGYWQELSKDDSCFLAPAWHAAGFAHAVVGYSLAPQATLPQIVDECVSAIRWLTANADELGFDREQMVIAGSSAGGYLAAACAAQLPVRGIVPISGIFDVAPLIGTSINAALGLDAATAEALNLLNAKATFAPAVITYGNIETSEFKRQSQAFAERLRANGLPCERFEIAERNHFDVVHELANPQSRLFQSVHQLFK
jgi:arylformamidase